MAFFDPLPGNAIELFGESWEIQPHPAAPKIPYIQEGRKASVYQLRRQDGEYYALKAFKRSFQDPEMETICQQISRFGDITGMEACQRKVITPDNDVFNKYTEFRYAVLMPWIKAYTWFDMLRKNQNGNGNSFKKGKSVQIASKLAKLLSNLESKEAAHTDPSAANLLLDIEHEKVFLVDLEDMYAPGFTKPAKISTGSDGYQHKKSVDGQWRQDGDRFAGAVLLVEILVCGEGGLISESYGETFFDPCEMQDIQSQRYLKVQKYLDDNYPQVGALFEQAWSSNDLSECPKFADWFTGLSNDNQKKVVICRPKREMVVGWKPFHETLWEDAKKNDPLVSWTPINVAHIASSDPLVSWKPI